MQYRWSPLLYYNGVIYKFVLLSCSNTEHKSNSTLVEGGLITVNPNKDRIVSIYCIQLLTESHIRGIL